MAEAHGKETYVSLDGEDLSTFTDSTTPTSAADEHDSTCYGADGHEYASGGLKTSAYTIGGKYITGATGPRAVIQPLVGTKVPFVYRPEGTGSTLPEDTSTVFVKSYNQTSPVADIVRWTAELTVSGVVTYGVQG